ncbi:MAG: hypothetical protein QM817_37450 [Archangium sp.]
MTRRVLVVLLLSLVSCRRKGERFVARLQVHRDTTCACATKRCVEDERRAFETFMDEELGARVVSMKDAPVDLRERILRMQKETAACGAQVVAE